MRQGRPSKHEIKEMEIDKISKLKEEPHLSGAYIRSLVKQLTSSKTKDSMNPKELDSGSVVEADAIPVQNLTKFSGGLEQNQHTQHTQQPQQHKKQVRRRLHTSRPYQERLLNMAEARREIVTALKFHRAAMKQASEQQQGQQQQQPQSPSMQPAQNPCAEQESGRMKSRRNPRIYPSATSNFSNYLENLSYTPNFPHHHHHPSPNPFALSASPITTLPVAENLNFTLPNQTLGLNLNFHDFNNIDTSLYHNSSSSSNNNNNNLSFYSTSTSNSVSSPSSSSSPTICAAVDQEVPGSGSGAAIQMEVGPPVVGDGLESSATTTSGGGGLHAAMDDEEMAEIRSIGEQHQMEWNDTMNLVTSAWWFKFLNTMELGGPNMKSEDDDDYGYHPFDEVMEFPSWLSANENETCFQHHFDDYCPEDYFQNPALPCHCNFVKHSMDIGEFEGMDGEWLA
ncbi:uncharacterized protein LOC107420164 isoform X1 [Ziziphus jujuba]|uniref:Uncharacterized protein LOC107420164 isoform X1 n=3 Tax=Ziziphus jujuba TaxID=326968 RepID=A0A6P6G8G1_ZIZJJ|nr:uncharacterized protein LOC107420164 isoform X1 [Ziziphus jujuba]XP_024930400.3 uncharacterized protein LOC107420164 isoform X1 [Ziziphus jujuba]